MKLSAVCGIGIGVIGLAAGVTAGAAHMPISASAQLITVTAGDLGVPDVGLLPTNPFYFLKEWRRGVQRAFAGDALAKAATELRIINEKAAEVAAVVFLKSDDGGINSALRNYRDEQPTMRSVVQNLSDQATEARESFLTAASVVFMRHERLFDSIAEEFSDQPSTVAVVTGAQTMLEETVAAALTKGTPDVFVGKLETALAVLRGGDLHNLYAAAVLARLHETASADAQQALADAYNRFMQKGQADLQRLIGQADLQTLQDSLKELPAQSAERALVGERIFEKQKASLNVPALLPAAALQKAAESLPDCFALKRQLSDLWSSFAKSAVTAQEYAQHYADLKERYDQCVSEAPASSTPSKS